MACSNEEEILECPFPSWEWGWIRRRMWQGCSRWVYSPQSTETKGMGHLWKTWSNRYFRGRNWTRLSKLWYVRHESDLCYGISYFENITREDAGICPECIQENTEVNYCLSVQKYWKWIGTRQIYATQGCKSQLGGQTERIVSCNWKPMTLEEIYIHCSMYVDGYSRAAWAETLLVQWTRNLCSCCC